LPLTLSDPDHEALLLGQIEQRRLDQVHALGVRLQTLIGVFPQSSKFVAKH
jgi:hypothetical protein